MTPGELLAAQQAVLAVHAGDALLDYLQALIAATRSGQWFVEGLCPRAGIAVLRAAKARALMDRRDYVAPDDIQAVLAQTVAHRLHAGGRRRPRRGRAGAGDGQGGGGAVIAARDATARVRAMVAGPPPAHRHLDADPAQHLHRAHASRLRLRG